MHTSNTSKIQGALPQPGNIQRYILLRSFNAAVSQYLCHGRDRHVIDNESGSKSPTKTMKSSSITNFVVDPSLFQIPPENTRYGDPITKFLKWSQYPQK